MALRTTAGKENTSDHVAPTQRSVVATQPAHGILQMQRLYGNRAVSHYLASVAQLQQANRGVLQRVDNGMEVEDAEMAEEDKEDEEATVVQDFKNELQRAVDLAFAVLNKRPSLEGTGFEELDGHTSLWVETWNGYAQNGAVHQMSAARFGYAVESIAMANFAPALPDDYKWLAQAARTHTRPDVTLEKNGFDIGWFDITAENSERHIDDKHGWENMQYTGEMLYPSVNITELEDDPEYEFGDDFDPEEIRARIERAKLLRAYRQGHWKVLGDQIFAKFRDETEENPASIRPRYKPQFRDPLIRDNEFRNVMIGLLANEFTGPEEEDLTDEITAKFGAIMKALGLANRRNSFMAYGSVAEGEVFLSTYDETTPADLPDEWLV